MQDELDDHLEAIFEGRNDDETIHAIMDRVDIADEHDGMCVECGVLDPDAEPFDYLFSDSPAVLRQRH